MLAPKIASALSKGARNSTPLARGPSRPQYMKKFVGNDLSDRSRARNTKFFNLINCQVISLTAREMETLLDLNIKAGKPQRNLDIAAKIAEDPLKRRFLTPRIYLYLLELVATERNLSLIPLALNLIREMSLTDCLPADFEKAAEYLFRSFEICLDFTQLLSLKIVYQNIISKESPTPNAALSYLACYIYVFLNSGQTLLAIEHFLACMQCFKTEAERTAFLQSLPLHKLVNILCLTRDCDALLVVLQELVNCDYISGIDLPDWAEVLSVSLWHSNYDLVKLVYDNIIMRGIDLLEYEDLTLGAGSAGNHEMLDSLSGSTLHEILQCLSMNGDVSLCMSLIEWHFVHQAKMGKDTLTKELCIEMIRAYCFHSPDAKEVAKSGTEDTLVKIVLDAIEAFVRKRQFTFDYIDIVDAFLHKVNTYRVFDAKVARALEKETVVALPPMPPSISPEAEEIPEEEVLLKKRSNTGIQESALGGVLKNTLILLDFIADHMSYISGSNYSDETRQIFVNCTLAHLAVYQNTTGVVCALRLMKETDPQNFPGVLDASLYEIILKSFSESPAAMLTGYRFYSHMKQKNQPVSSKGLQYLVISSLRGNSYSPLLEFYVYEYLKLEPHQISHWLLRRIKSYKRLNEEGKALLRVLECYQCSQDFTRLDELWDANGFTKLDPVLSSSDEEYERFLRIDERDNRILELVFED